LDWQIPLTVLLGTTVNVSPSFGFNGINLCSILLLDDTSFPSDLHEALGYFVGLCTPCGHAMTFNKVLTADTRHVIHPAHNPLCPNPNLRFTDLIDGEPPSRIFVSQDMTQKVWKTSLSDLDPDSGEVKQIINPSMVTVDTSELVETPDLVGKTFCVAGQKEGTIHCACSPLLN
jgi:hypothetical protein